MLTVAVTDATLPREARFTKFAEAETLLLHGHEALQQGENVERKFQKDSLTRPVRLYQAWEKPKQAAGWQQKLDEFNQTEEKPETHWTERRKHGLPQAQSCHADTHQKLSKSFDPGESGNPHVIWKGFLSQRHHQRESPAG